jgi:thioredoxin 1
MSELILEVTEDSLDQDVLAVAGPVLLDLWAPWCAPCRALAPVLKKLSTEYQGELQIAKVDVEKYPEVQRRFGVRGIPTMILFRNGEEAARATGSKSGEEMRRWLMREGVKASVDVTSQVARNLDELSWGAFYGDIELRDFLMSRIRARIAAGRVKAARMPYWIDGVGTISAALVGSAEFRVFEGVTGMPASFACVLEFCAQNDLSSECVDALLGCIPLGADLRSVAPRMALNLFDGSMGDWSVIIDDVALDALRQRWIGLVIRTLAGEEIKRDEWTGLVLELEALRSADMAPERQVQDEFIATLTALSPLPHADDGASWARGMLLSGRYLMYVLAASLFGWTSADFALERFRHSWFVARQAQEPGGEFTEETLVVARGEWMHEHGERQRGYDAFFEKNTEHVASINMKARSCLAALVFSAPIIKAA